MTVNSLPNHAGPIINAVMEESGMRIKIRVDEVKSSMDEMYKVMVMVMVMVMVRVRVRAIPEMKVFERSCCYCREASLNHTIGECEKFKFLLQRMMDCGKV